MNCRARSKVQIGPELARDIARVEELWTEAREANGSVGPYLFGSFSMADAFFAPVVMRFITYGISLNSSSEKYMEAIASNAAVSAWVDSAKNEKEVLPQFHVGEVVDA